MAEDKYNTNLASEFYVLSMLYRLGANATLTLGNKKSVDIVVVRGEGDLITVDVKGLAGTTGWPIDNVRIPKEGHFVIFVCYLGKITEPTVLPEVWIVPSTEVERFTYFAPGGRKVVQRSRLKADASSFKDAWHLVI